MCTPSRKHACAHRVRENTDATKHSNFSATDENNRSKWPRSIVRSPGTMIACCELGLPPIHSPLSFFLIAIISHRLPRFDPFPSESRLLLVRRRLRKIEEPSISPPPPPHPPPPSLIGNGGFCPSLSLPGEFRWTSCEDVHWHHGTGFVARFLAARVPITDELTKKEKKVNVVYEKWNSGYSRY